MSAKQEVKKNPVAELREKFFEKKKNQAPSQEIKDTLKKKRPGSEDTLEPLKKSATNRRPRKEIDL